MREFNVPIQPLACIKSICVSWETIFGHTSSMIMAIMAHFKRGLSRNAIVGEVGDLDVDGDHDT